MLSCVVVISVPLHGEISVIRSCNCEPGCDCNVIPGLVPCAAIWGIDSVW